MADYSAVKKFIYPDMYLCSSHAFLKKLSINIKTNYCMHIFGPIFQFVLTVNLLGKSIYNGKKNETK